MKHKHEADAHDVGAHLFYDIYIKLVPSWCWEHVHKEGRYVKTKKSKGQWAKKGGWKLRDHKVLCLLFILP